MNCICCGRMKQGKTTLAMHLAKEHSRGVVAFDPRHMITGAVYVHSAEELEQAIEQRRWREGPIIVRPNGLHIEDDFEGVCDVLFSPPERYQKWAFVVDEAASLQKCNSINKHLDRAIRQHPRSVMVIQTTHSLQDYHRASKDLMSQLYCFRMIGRSLDAMVDYCDGDEEFAMTIMSLQDHQLVRYDFEAPNNEQKWVVWDDPSVWFEPVTKEAVKNVSTETEENPGGNGLGRGMREIRPRPAGRGYGEIGRCASRGA